MNFDCFSDEMRLCTRRTPYCMQCSSALSTHNSAARHHNNNNNIISLKHLNERRTKYGVRNTFWMVKISFSFEFYFSVWIYSLFLPQNIKFRRRPILQHATYLLSHTQSRNWNWHRMYVFIFTRRFLFAQNPIFVLFVFSTFLTGSRSLAPSLSVIKW